METLLLEPDKADDGYIKSEFLYTNDSTKLLIYPSDEDAFLEAEAQYDDKRDTLYHQIKK